MSSIKIIFSSVCLIVVLQEIYGHGRMMDPVSRSSAWRKNFGTPKNYNDNEVFCGGATVQHVQNDGKCGVCGDIYTAKQPRANENGGKYGLGKIVRTYNQGQRVTVEIELTTNHKGHFEFAVCPLDGPNAIETEECFNKHPVQLASGGYNYIVVAPPTAPPLKSKPSAEYIKFDVVLPKGLTCKHCSFRWHYRVGNNWGACDVKKTVHGEGGCAPQETFRNCADISIV